MGKEYFCHSCGQLRLCFETRASCGNCGSVDIVSGEPGELDKEALKKAYRESLTLPDTDSKETENG